MTEDVQVGNSRRLIDQIELPQGLRGLTFSQLDQVCVELRAELIKVVADRGGHLASSLGAVEICVALHRFFDTPQDKIVFDVGHQAYAHKMLTGRLKAFKTLRQKGGLSGFLKRFESEYDAFGGGHAGTSISAAVGLCTALQAKEAERFVVAVIGDASIANGMAFEALNHAGSLGLKHLIVLLNDNEMSISPSVGALSWLFSAARTSPFSNRLREKLSSSPKSQVLHEALSRMADAGQGLLCSVAMLFEAFGFQYIGPVDGHNLTDLLTALEHAAAQERPVLLHVRTLKGKGFAPAERNPTAWHGVCPFKLERVEAKTNAAPGQVKTFSDFFGAALIEARQADDKVVAITAAMADGTGLEEFARRYPASFYDVGISEQHAVTFAAGLAAAGKKPVCAIYSSFLQRAYDQIIHDVCLQKLPVVFAIDRAGLVGADGETHQGVFDLAYLGKIPNMVVMSPKDEVELARMLEFALRLNRPAAIRYPRAAVRGSQNAGGAIQLGKGEIIGRGRQILMLCLGPPLECAAAAAQRLFQLHGISSTVVNARFVKPLDLALLRREIPRHELVCTLEDHALSGGFGSAVLEAINDQGLPLKNPVLRFGVQDGFVPQATQAEQWALNGYDEKAICQRLLARLCASHGACQAPVDWGEIDHPPGLFAAHQPTRVGLESRRLHSKGRTL